MIAGFISARTCMSLILSPDKESTRERTNIQTGRYEGSRAPRCLQRSLAAKAGDRVVALSGLACYTQPLSVLERTATALRTPPSAFRAPGRRQSRHTSRRLGGDKNASERSSGSDCGGGGGSDGATSAGEHRVGRDVIAQPLTSSAQTAARHRRRAGRACAPHSGVREGAKGGGRGGVMLVKGEAWVPLVQVWTGLNRWACPSLLRFLHHP